MGNFNDDDFFNENFGDDFFSRWEEFYKLMNSQKGKDLFRKDLEELMKFMNQQYGSTPLTFRILPLDPERENDFNIPNDDMDIEKGEDEDGKWETKHWSSPDGKMSFSSFSRSSDFNDLNNLSDDELMERYQQFFEPRRRKPETKEEKLDKLQKTLDYLVEKEKYEKAAEVKKMIDELKKPSEEKTEE